jgi:hypothetical protein
LSTKWGTTIGLISEYVSNSSGSSSATDEWVNAKSYRGDKIWQEELLTLSTGVANIRLVGRFGDTGTGSVLLEIATAATHSQSIPIIESMDRYRVEYSIDTIGTDIFSSRIKVMDDLR